MLGFTPPVPPAHLGVSYALDQRRSPWTEFLGPRYRFRLSWQYRARAFRVAATNSVVALVSALNEQLIFGQNKLPLG